MEMSLRMVSPRFGCERTEHVALHVAHKEDCRTEAAAARQHAPDRAAVLRGREEQLPTLLAQRRRKERQQFDAMGVLQQTVRQRILAL